MTSKYEIWLTVMNNALRFQLPVNPPSIDTESGSQNTTVSIAGLGEITVLQDPAAKVFEFSSFFPATYGPYCEYFKIPTPWEFVTFIEFHKHWTPFRFIITNTPINMLVSIEDFKYTEKAGDIGSLNYSIKLKEYRVVTPREINVVEAQVFAKPAERPAPPPPKTYTVEAGDYLIKIARKLGLNDWHVIYDANKDKIENPNLIYPGQVFVIP